MPEPTWSLSAALCVGSTKPTYNHWKTSGEIGSRVQQTREQATLSIMLLVMSTKLRCWKSSAWKLRVSQRLRQPRSGIFGYWWMMKCERMAKKFDVCFMLAKESLPFTKYPTLLELKYRHGVDLGPAYRMPDSAKAFTSYIAKSQHRTSSLTHYQALDHAFSVFWWTKWPMLVTKKTSWWCFCTALRCHCPRNHSMYSLLVDP